MVQRGAVWPSRRRGEGGETPCVAVVEYSTGELDERQPHCVHAAAHMYSMRLASRATQSVTKLCLLHEPANI